MSDSGYLLRLDSWYAMLALFVLLGALVTAFTIQRLVRAYQEQRVFVARIGDLETLVADLQRQVDEYEQQTRMLRDRVDFLLTELSKRNGVDQAAIPNGTTALRPHLVVCVGDDEALAVDLAAFRKVQQRTGLRFTRLMRCSSERLERYLERARASQNPVRYLHLSMHAGPNGVRFADGVRDGVWLSEQLKDVQALLIDACESDQVGDLLGVVPFVVTMIEEIENHDAMLFAELFWTGIGQGQEPIQAYYQALDRCPPAVAEFAQVHV